MRLMGESRTAEPIRVRATIWAIDLPHERAAVQHLMSGQWAGSARFNLRGLAKADPGAPCPLDLEHPAVLAFKEGRGWKWVLHKPEVRAPLAIVGAVR